DPLEPLALGLPAITRADGAAPRAAQDVAIARTIQRAFDAAGTVHYIDAAKEGAALAAPIGGRDAVAEPGVRARWARGALPGAGAARGGGPAARGADEDLGRRPGGRKKGEAAARACARRVGHAVRRSAASARRGGSSRGVEAPRLAREREDQRRSPGGGRGLL